MEPQLVIIVVVVVVLAVGGWLWAVYNRLVKTQQHVRESWGNIDVELKRRYDLIPNLVSTVRAYATHERETLQRVIELRNRAAANQGSPHEQSSDENALLLSLKRLFVVAESYPQLRANQNFLELQNELAITEDRIAAARRFYNGNVRDINAMCASFPTNVVAGMFGFKAVTYFELSSEAERVVPRVEV